MPEERELTFEDVLGELHVMMGQPIHVAVYGKTEGEGKLLADLGGRLEAAARYDEDEDHLAFAVAEGTPGIVSAFMLTRESFEGARWRDTTEARKLLIDVSAGSLAITLTVRDRFLLVLEDGERYDPEEFVTEPADWKVGETFVLDDGEQLRILSINTEISAELVEKGFDGVFIVEPV